MRRAFLKRVFIAFLFVSFLGGTSATQAMAIGMSPDKPCGMAMDVGKGSSADADKSQKTRSLPACVSIIGCVIFVGMAAPDLSAATPLRWSSAWYGDDLTGLAGRSIEPDLSPPILA